MEKNHLNPSRINRLYCSQCNTAYDYRTAQTFATCCGKPLLISYDLDTDFPISRIKDRPNTIWRYFELLPVLDEANIVSLNEGMTPVIQLEKLAARNGFDQLFLKDETNNPTGSFKARGLSVAISKAKELGIRKCIIPTAGNAGGALAAYCAKANIAATVIMPAHTPRVFKDECFLYGAELVLIDGLISDCGKKAQEMNKEGAYFDMSTLKEPYRLEGKKTMGYEIAEQFDWELPDVIIYPAGGGTGLIGIWKAFNEMKALGWIKGPFPKMVAVQSAKCAPISEAVKDPIHWKENFTPEATIANGLAVPYPFGMDLMLDVLSASNGETVLVNEDEIMKGILEFTRKEGILVSPEGAATYIAFQQLLGSGKITEGQKVLLLNTGTGYKYLENIIH
ncbi:MAG: threonine synthase [Sphingobacteriia bacterium]|nr:threonine synthase [Sphingobacteriia bacterium]